MAQNAKRSKVSKGRSGGNNQIWWRASPQATQCTGPSKPPPPRFLGYQMRQSTLDEVFSTVGYAFLGLVLPPHRDYSNFVEMVYIVWYGMVVTPLARMYYIVP
eukprot:3786547-Pleurochrysis_carterae.AAC.1